MRRIALILGACSLVLWGVADVAIRMASSGRVYSKATVDAIPSVRARKVFGLEEFVVVSQPFHVRRAVFIARGFGINAVGYEAEDVSGRHSVKTCLREQLAKIAAIIDVVIRRRPKFLGPQEQVPG